MRADLAELWCLGVNFPLSWWVSCLHPELRPVLSWHRGEEMSPAWCDWARASREHHRSSRTNSLTIKPGSQSTLSKKAPDREPEGTQIWVCVSSKENSKITKKDQVKSMSLPGSHPKPPGHLSHSHPHTGSPGAHLVSSFIGKVLHSFAGIPMKSRGNPLWSPRYKTSAFCLFLCLYPNNCQIEASMSIGNTSIISGYTHSGESIKITDILIFGAVFPFGNNSAQILAKPFRPYWTDLRNLHPKK